MSDRIVPLIRSVKPGLLLFALGSLLVSACGSKSPEAQSVTRSVRITASELHGQFTTEVDRGNYSKAVEIAHTLEIQFPESNDTKAVQALVPRVQAALDKEVERNRVELRQLISVMKKSVDDFSHATTFYASPKIGLFASNVSLMITRSSAGMLTLVAELQYGGDGWIFWKNAEFNVDGSTISDKAFANMKVRQDIREGSFVNETAYKVIDDSELGVFDKLAEGKKVLIRFDGRDRYDFELDQDRKDNLRRVLRLYKLLELGTPIT